MKKLLHICLPLLISAGSTAQIGLGTVSPNSSLDVRGAMAVSLRTITASTTLTISDETIIFTGISAATVTLPDASTCAGRIYWIKNASSTLPVPVLTISPTASQTIDGVASTTVDEPYEVIRLVSNGTNWSLFNESIAIRKTSSAASVWYQGGNKLSTAKTVGTVSNYDMAFMTNNLERIRINTSGFLGIGTNNPTARWHSVNDNDDAGNDYILDDYGTTNTAGFFIRKHRGTVAAPLDLQSGDLISQFRFSGRYNSTLNRVDGSGIDAYYLGNSSTNTTDLRFFASNNELMRIDTAGRTAIGSANFDATNPEKLLIDAGTTTSYNVLSGKGVVDNYLQLNIQNRSATANASSDIVATAANGSETTNYIDMGINSGGYSNTSLPILSGTDLAYLYGFGNDFVIGNSTAGSDLVFFTNAYTAASERMRITAAGNVGIGTSTPSDKLTVAGIISPATDNTYTLGESAARWSAVWSANGTIQTSDIRFKTNIQPLEYGTRTIMQLRPVRYNWKNDSTHYAKIGLIAQEVRKQVPEVVVGNEKKENLGMNYSELVVVLINTIKEQNQRLELLTHELAKLEK